MNKLLLFALAAILGSSQLSSAATCISGSLSGYVGLGSGGCTIGSNTFSDFRLLGSTTGATEIPAANVVLFPLGDSLNPGISVSVAAASASGVVQELLFNYKVTGNAYSGATIALSGSSQTGDGAVSGLMNFCAGALFVSDGLSGCTAKTGGLVTLNSAQNSDSALFSAVTLLSVTDDLTIDGGLRGSAQGATFINQFTAASAAAVPEPVSLTLAGIGLALLAGWRVRSGNRSL